MRLKKIVAPGVYQNTKTGKFTYRPWVAGRRTERTLEATTLREALKEYHSRINQSQSLDTVAEFCKLYIEAGAPDRTGRARGVDFASAEKSRVKHITKHIGNLAATDLRIHHCLDYRDRRIRTVKKGCSGLRTVDMELGTLSNALHYAVSKGLLDVNRLIGRPMFVRSSEVSHCREHCPRSGDELHQLAAKLMSDYSTVPLGWQMLFEACSGCRTNEALPLKWDAKPHTPGYIKDRKYLCIARLKQGGEDPYDYIEINGALELVLAGMRKWNPNGKWFFQSARRPDCAVKSGSLALALRRITKKLLPGRRITSHGMRAFYVTWRRSEKVALTRIAEDVGHQSGIGLLLTTYGRRLPPWAQGKFGPFPEKQKAAWSLKLKPVNNSVGIRL